MSETTQEAVKVAIPGYTLDEDYNTGENYIQREGTERIYLNEFGGASKGLQYHIVQFVPAIPSDATDEQKEQLFFNALQQAGSRYGNEKVLDLFNVALAQNVRTKVLNSRVPSFKDEKATKDAVANLVKTNPCIFSVEDAIAFVPGVREISYNGYLNLSKLANKEGNSDKAEEYLMKAVEVLSRQRAMKTSE